LLARRRSLSFDLADGLLALFLLWSAASALFATNHWVAQRALGVSVSGAVVFWGARSVAERGSYRPVLIAAAIAAVCAAVFSLAQAYGLDSEYFSANRAPGGTFGNRNFVAHIAVIGLPSARVVHCDDPSVVRRAARLARRGDARGGASCYRDPGRHGSPSPRAWSFCSCQCLPRESIGAERKWVVASRGSYSLP